MAQAFRQAGARAEKWDGMAEAYPLVFTDARSQKSKIAKSDIVRPICRSQLFMCFYFATILELLQPHHKQRKSVAKKEAVWVLTH